MNDGTLKVNKANLENLKDDFYFYVKSVNSKSFEEQDFYLLRQYNIESISKLKFNDVVHKTEISASVINETDEDEISFEEIQITVSELINSIKRNVRDYPDIFLQMLIIRLIICEGINYISTESYKELESNIFLVKKGIDEILFKKGDSMTYLSKSIYPILNFINPNVPYNVFKRASAYIKNYMKNMIEV